jgi:hypothetical protein
VITHFETTITLMGVLIGWLAALVAGVWRARGWIDKLNTTDARLASAIEALTSTQQDQHRENQARFREIEGRLPPRPRRIV